MLEPLVSLEFRRPRQAYFPGDLLECERQVDALEADEIQAVESSVLWYTEGKGEEDFHVHHFERRVPADAEEGDLRPLHRFSTPLPNSPLSYSGAIVKVRWCARVRVFLRRGKEAVLEKPLILGNVPGGQPVAVPAAEAASDPAGVGM